MPITLVANATTRKSLSLDPELFGCHIAVLAQSGSGKSFLIGRVIEELALATKARIVVLDPNSDFVRVGDVDTKAWSKPPLRKWLGKESADAFKERWSRVKFVVLSNRNLPHASPLRISWASLSDQERANVMDIDQSAQPELYWTLVLAGELARKRWDHDIEAQARSVDDSETDYDFEFFRTVADEICDFLLGAKAEDDISKNPLANNLRSGGAAIGLRFRSLVYSLELFEIWRGVGESPGSDIADVLSTNPRPQLTVIDLLSVATEAERVALASRAIATIWKNARAEYSDAVRDIDEPDKRVPTIVVIDEAHNLVPTHRPTPAAERLAADILRVAAEGRKFGLSLVIVTQRPRKIDPSVLSECDGLFLMKMTNQSDLGSAKELFGFINDAAVQNAKALKVGEVFMQGRLNGGTSRWHVAPRRTIASGRSLDEKYWACPNEGE